MATPEESNKRARCANASIRIELISTTDEALGPPMDVPASTNIEELEKLVNTLRKLDVWQPYAFYANENLVEDVLADHVHTTEEVLKIRYQPLAVFRVRRATRCGNTLPGHTDAILQARYSPNGKFIASAGGDATVRFWDSLSATPQSTLSGHRSHVLCLSWSADATRLASGDRRGQVRVWEQNRSLHILQRHTSWITALSWAPLHISPDLLASASKDATVKVWRQGRLLESLSGHTDSVEALAWGGDGVLHTGSRDRTIKLWAFSSTSGRIELKHTLSGHAHRINSLALSCAYVCRTGPFDVKRSNKQAEADFSLEARAQARYDAFVATSGSDRLASCSDDATAFLWPAKVRLTGHQQAINAIHFSPDGRKLASASFDKKIKLWNGKTGAFLATLTGHVAAVYALAWAPDSRMLASASKDSTLKVWHTADDVKPAEASAKAQGTRKFAAALETLSGHHDEVFDVDWAPQGAHLVSASKDRTLKIWHP